LKRVHGVLAAPASAFAQSRIFILLDFRRAE
jgi:hypothetical protein